MTAHLTNEEQQLWHAWKAATDCVRDQVAVEIKSATGLSDPDFGILTRLVDLGSGQMRQNEVAESMKWHRSRLSHQLTRMQERGLLTRTSVDGGVLVSISAQGRALVDAARPVHAAAVRRCLIEPTQDIDHATLLSTLRHLATQPPA